MWETRRGDGDRENWRLGFKYLYLKILIDTFYDNIAL